MTHPLLQQLKDIRYKDKRCYTMMFHCMSYYERLDYTKTLLDMMTCKGLWRQTHYGDDNKPL